MKQFCSKLEVVPVADVSNITGNDVTLIAGASFDTFISDSLSVNLQKNASDAGLTVSLSQDVYIDKVSLEIARKYSYPRYCVIVIHYDDGTYTAYGTSEYPVVLFIIPGLQQDTLSLSLSTTVLPLI